MRIRPSLRGHVSVEPGMDQHARQGAGAYPKLCGLFPERRVVDVVESEGDRFRHEYHNTAWRCAAMHFASSRASSTLAMGSRSWTGNEPGPWRFSTKQIRGMIPSL